MMVIIFYTLAALVFGLAIQARRTSRDRRRICGCLECRLMRAPSHNGDRE